MDTPVQRLAYVTWQLAQAIGSQVERRVRPLDLTTAQALALSTLHATPGLTTAELARRSSFTPQSMGSAIADLVDRNLVAYAQSERDRRVKKLSLTSDGERLAHRVAAVIDGIDDQLLDALDRRDRTVALQLLTRMLARANPTALKLVDGSEDS
ncbi:MarR family transcriptional regulator [Nocardia vinacea]|uniref:MarR family winged helix-turn-helix transcriptional regulator n=1 Tax=Nocardia vinacea TaxID=96468 RepID=UPI0034479F5B